MKHEVKYHILNRRVVETSSRKRRKGGKGWTTETRIGSKPAGAVATEGSKERGDIIYINLSGYGVVAKGKILDRRLNILSSMQDVLEFIRTKAEDKSKLFWGEIILEKCKTLSKAKPLYVLELLSEYEILPNLIKLDPKKFNNQWSFRTLEGPLEKDKNYEEDKFNPEIPYQLRRDIQILCNQFFDKEFVYDIDHVVPKSCGGPGNIVENLIPLNLSFNRGKRDKIPAGLFIEARKHKALKELNLSYVNSRDKYSKNIFFDDIKARDEAREIIRVINSNKFNSLEAKAFYKNIRDFHFAGFSDLLNQVK